MKNCIPVVGMTLALAQSSLLAHGLECGKTISGFKVKSVTEVKDIACWMWKLEYVKNGAELIWLEREDENKTFAIAFKTIPEDDTGIAHIMEHSVLNGSNRYPVKEPFVELLKSSFATYLNAYTGDDRTVYPVATKNNADFQNLVSVYMDAVLHPLSIKEDWQMDQEGWHYEYDGTNLTRNGVVYSEMKGYYGRVQWISAIELQRRLFPDNTYGKDAGGDPSHIPELTHEKYRAFHKRFYHPSNARIFLDGKIEIDKTLALLDSYLSDFDRQAIDVTVPRQKAVTTNAIVPYECAESGNRTMLTMGWVAGNYDDGVGRMALDVICQMLTDSNEAPLKKALLDKGLCEDVELDFDGSVEQGKVLLLAQNIPDGKGAECRREITATLERICREGLDKKRLAAILDNREFCLREQDTSQRGIYLLHVVLNSWLYGGKPEQNLDYTGIFGALRANANTDWFETLMKEALIDNAHRAAVILVPSKTLADDRKKVELSELAELKKGMSEAELKQIAERAAWLREHQSRAERPEDLAKLPRLRLADIPERGSVPQYSVEKLDAVEVIRPKSAANGIFYLDLCFSLGGLSDSELLDAPFLARLLGDLRTEKYSVLGLRNGLDGSLGHFGISVDSFETGPRFVVHVAALDSRKEEAIDLLSEMLTKTSYADEKAIAIIRAQMREECEQEARSNGRSMSMARAAHVLSERNRVNDLLGGIAQLRRLQGKEVVNLKALANRIFTKQRLTISFSGIADDAFLRRVIAICPQANDTLVGAVAAVEPPRIKEGFVADGTVSYMTVANKLPADVPHCGSQQVAANIISLEHLWNEIRVKGGAYGGRMSVTVSGDVLYSSWSDPNPARSMVEFRRSAEVLRKFVDSGASFEHYQVSAIKATEPNLTIRGEAAFAYRLFFNKRNPEILQQLRKEMLTTTPQQLKSFADVLEKLNDDTATCIFANQNMLDKCAVDTSEPVIK